MSAADFDSRDYSKRLVAVGFSAAQADLQAEVTGDVMKEVATLSQTVDEQRAASAADRHLLESMLAQAVKTLDAKIERAVSELNAKIDRVAAELEAKIDYVAAELNAKIDHVAAQLDAKIDRVAAELNVKIDRVAAELDAKIDRIAAELRAEIARAKWSNVRWTFAIVTFVCSIQTSVVVALLRSAH